MTTWPPHFVCCFTLTTHHTIRHATLITPMHKLSMSAPAPSLIQRSWSLSNRPTMKYLNLLLLVAVVSVNGHEDYGPANSYGGSPTDDRDNIREASPIGRRIEESVHGDIASFHDLTQSRRQLYVSEIETLVDILRETEDDRSASSAPPLHFEIEVDLSTENDGDDLSHLRRLQVSPTTGERSLTSTLLLDLFTAPSAISPDTTFDFTSVSSPEPDIASKLTVLVNDPTNTIGLTVLSVNTGTSKISGVQRGKSGSVRKLNMFKVEDGEIVTSAARQKRMFMGPIVRGRHQSFTCGVEHKEEWDERMLRHESDEWKGIRGGTDEEHHDHHVHEHQHNDHEHEHQHFNIRQLQNMFSGKTNGRLYEAGGPRIRFQINVVIDIDAEFIAKQGGAVQAVEYVNLLVTVANSILGNEVGVRLNVIHIQEVTYFKPVATLRDGLKVMRRYYEDKFSDNIQLRHALLGKYIGGGIAFIDAVCDKRYGVGLSSGLEGRINSLDEDAVYDLFIMMHEIGHSLGSDHTFESEAFKPRVDTCGLTECPKQLPIANSASIMSYCDFCDGGLSNVALSMGGVWTGEHPRLDVKNWEASKEFSALTVSKNPERVSHQIWKTLYSKGQCVIKTTSTPTSSPVTDRPTTAPTTTHPTLNPTSLSPTSLSPTSSRPTLRPSTDRPTTSRPTAEPSSSPSVNYGPFYLSPRQTCEDNCYLSRGIMFNVGLESEAGKDILIESIVFEHSEPKSTGVSIDLYRTYVGGYEDKTKFSAQWHKLDSMTVNATSDQTADPDRYSVSEFKLNPPMHISANDVNGFYVRASASILRVGTGSNANTDVNGAYLSSGSTVMGGVFGIAIEGYLFSVNIKYSFFKPTEDSTVSPTMRPTLTGLATPGPSERPSIALQSGSSSFASSTASIVTSVSAETSDTTSLHWLNPSNICTSNCLASSGFMFDVNLAIGATSKILIKSIEFEHLRGSDNSSVDIYTTYYGSHVGKEQQPNQWRKVANVALPNTNANTTAIFDPPVYLWSGTTQGFYFATKEGILLVGLGSFDISDSNGVSIEGGSLVFGAFGNAYSGYHLNARLGYDIKK